MVDVTESQSLRRRPRTQVAHISTSTSRTSRAAPSLLDETSPHDDHEKTSGHPPPVTHAPCSAKWATVPSSVSSRPVVITRCARGDTRNLVPQVTDTMPMMSITPRNATNRAAPIGIPSGDFSPTAATTLATRSPPLPVLTVPISNGNAPFTGWPSALVTRHTTT